MISYRVLWLFVFGSVSFATYGADVYKWVDEAGRIHYGESVPDQYKQKAGKIDSSGPEPTDAQRREAATRLAKEKAISESMTTSRTTPAAPGSVPATAGVKDKDNSCEAQKKRYAESELCFAPYRNATGGIKAEAFQHCVEVKEPKCSAQP